jgi:uncharacterized protein
VHLKFARALPVTQDDYCMNSRPENGRGFANTDLYRMGSARGAE